jgi:hypothetical protein
MFIVPRLRIVIVILKDICVYTENPIYVFPEMKLRGLRSQFLHSCFCERLQQNRQTDPGNI